MSGQSKEIVRLATMPRRGRGENGKPSQYVSARIWWLGREQEWLPGRQGLTVRRGELRQVIEALERAEKILAGKESVRADPRQQQIPGADRGADAEAF
jgi:hypothetical protein